MDELKITTPSLEPRLQRRYRMLVQSHLHSASKLVPGIAAPPSIHSSFAATQGAWRFLSNDRVTLPTLVEPLREVGRSRTQSLQSKFVLLVHDWCKLSYSDSLNKKDLIQVTHETDIGYDLTTSLLVSADDGSPLAPMEMQLKTGSGFFSTSSLDQQQHLGQLMPIMETAKQWGLPREIVHVIDREADSVDHYRHWDAKGHRYLIRADDRRVRWEGEEYLLSDIRRYLKERKQFRSVGKGNYRGKPSQLWVVETEVILHRAAKKKIQGKQVIVPGRPLKLRSIFVELRSHKNRVLAQWILLSNVMREWATTEHLARCYYWRWQIESFFKLLKSHGQQLEEWQQERGKSIARRLLIASMACIIVWQLQGENSKAAIKFKDVLIKLSGRQMKRNRPHTAPALLDGLGKLLSMLSLLEHYSLSQLKQLAKPLLFSSA
jgi:hypothetical protein